MILSLFTFILVMLGVTFCSYQKRLHLFEIFFILMTVWLITHSLSSIIVANLEKLAISSTPSLFWVHFFKRFLLYPLLIVFCFDFYLRVKTVLFRILLLGVLIIFLSLLEFLFIRLGVLINKGGYTFYFALAEWAFTVVLAYISWIWYRTKRLGSDD